MSSVYPQDAALSLVFRILVPFVALVYVVTFMIAEVDFRTLFLGNPFFVYAMAGVYVMHVLLCDRPRERWGAALCGLAISAAILLLRSGPGAATFQASAIVAAALLAVTSLAIQAGEILRGDLAMRRRHLALLRTSLILPLAVGIMMVTIWLIALRYGAERKAARVTLRCNRIAKLLLRNRAINHS